MDAARARLERLDREAHVWIVRPDAFRCAAQPTACEAVLSAEERARLERLRGEPNRLLYASAHALVRNALSHYASVPPEAWRFAATRRGRPAIVGPADAPPGLQFNLSHTPGLAACVVTRGCRCGIDVERTDRRRDPLAVARRVLSAPEYADLERQAPERQRERFLVYWTLKEAYAKACGEGLALPLRRTSFRIDGGRIEVAVDCKTDASWQLTSLQPDPRHLLAVAIQAAETRPRGIVVREWQPGGS